MHTNTQLREGQVDSLVEWIHKEYSIGSEEWELLEKRLGNLCRKITWQLLRQNHIANSDNFEIWNTEIQMALVRAACYYKRQCYLKKALSALESIKGRMNEQDRIEAEALLSRWRSRPKNGEPRFSREHEKRLAKLLAKSAAESAPKKESLVFDREFEPYAKRIIWNAQKTLGRKMSKQKQEATMLSLDDLAFLEGSATPVHASVPAGDSAFEVSI